LAVKTISGIPVHRLTGHAPRTFQEWCQRNAALFA
jgi:hypothetical protein